MSNLNLKVYWTNSEGTETDITYDVEKINIRKGLDQKSNNVTISLKNSMTRTPVGENKSFHRWVDDDNTLIIEENDTIKIQGKIDNTNSSLTDSDVLIVADVTEFQTKFEYNRSTLNLVGVDKTFNLLNQQWVSVYRASDAKNSPEIIKDVIENVTESPDMDGTFGITATLQTEPTYPQQKASATPRIQTRRIDNSVFPDVAIAKVYKPVYEWIDDLSTIEYTNDFAGGEDEDNPVQNRKMRYFIDKDSNMRWFYPDDDVDYTILISTITDENDQVKSYDLTFSTFDVVNFVIYNGGLDMYGAGTLNYWFDPSAKSRTLQTKYKAYNEVAILLFQDEINEGNLEEDNSTPGAFTFQGNRFKLATAKSYPITTSWGTNVASDDAYNTAFRSEVDRRCKSRARAYTNQRGSPRWKGKLVLDGVNMIAGELINLTSYIHGINSRLVRILDVQHVITRGGWTTTLTVEEDEPRIGDNVPATS